MSRNFAERFNELPGFLSNHVMISIIALGVGVLISVPLAVFLTRRASLRYPVLTAAGVIQTIPSLALLALMVPLLAAIAYGAGWITFFVTGREIPDDPQRVTLFPAFGFWPAVIGLTLYSILPILRNTVIGIMGVDPRLVEAARGVGMTSRQMLLKVELPLAAPVIIAGIRTATVWVVGIATLATPVGQKCLGNYIFTGLQTRNWTMVMFGVVGAALLAILLDLLIGGLQRSVQERKRALGFISGLALLVVIGAGIVSPRLVRWASGAGDAPIVRIGAKTFTEQYILSDLLALQLENLGFEAQQTESLGSTIIFSALTNGDIDLYVDYSGTIWANYMKREETPEPEAVLDEMSDWLENVHNVRLLCALGFENAYTLVMRREQAEKLNIETISDLARHARDMKVGGDYEFFGRPEWENIRDTYHLDFREQTSYDSSIMYQSVAQGQVDVIAAFSSDGRIAAYDLVTIEDNRHVIPPYDAVLLVGPSVSEDERILKALEPLVGAIDVQTMRKANHMVDRGTDKRTAREAARWLAEQIGVHENAADVVQATDQNSDSDGDSDGNGDGDGDGDNPDDDNHGNGR